MHSVYNTPVIDIASLKEHSQLLNYVREREDRETVTDTDRNRQTERDRKTRIWAMNTGQCQQLSVVAKRSIKVSYAQLVFITRHKCQVKLS